MGIALCHSIPRDIFAYIALLLLFIGFILQIGAIGCHNSKTGGGYITPKGGKKVNALAYLAVHPALYATKDSYNGASGYISMVLDPATKVCDPSAATLTFHCARFAEAYHTVNGIALASFISAVLAFIFGMFVTGRCSHKTADILGRFVLALSVPTALQCALIGISFVRIVGNAKKAVLANYTPTDGITTTLSFHRGFAPCLMITATVLFCVAFLLVFVRWVVVLCTRLRLKRSAASNPNDAQRMKDMHLVNDDWQRQKQILRTHARSVQVEMLIKEDAEEEEQEWNHEHHHDHDAPISDDDAFGVTFRRKHAAEMAEAAAEVNRTKAAEAAAAQKENQRQLTGKMGDGEDDDNNDDDDSGSAFRPSDYSPSSHAEQQEKAAAEMSAAKQKKKQEEKQPKESHDPHEL